MRARLKVREVAQSKSISQYMLSKRSGVDLRTVQRLFRDPYRGVNIFTLQRLADVLNVDISSLVESVPDDPI